MKKISLILFSMALIGFTSCSKDDEDPKPAETITVDTSKPQGAFTVQRMGSIMEENGTGSTGTVEIGADANTVNFLHFGSNFMTELGTGTVTLYFSTSKDFNPDPMNGNPDLRVIGAITKNGEQYFKLSGPVEAKWTHVLLWCGSANIPFGYAELK